MGHFMSQPLGVVLAVQEQFRHAKNLGEILEKETQTILNAISAMGCKLVIDDNGIAEDARVLYPFIKDDIEPNFDDIYKFLEGNNE